MNEHEREFIAAFIVKERRPRYRRELESGDPKHRDQCLSRLCHCRDLQENRVEWLARDPRSVTRDEQIAEELTRRGSPARVYLMAYCCPEDGRSLPLLDALRAVTAAGWGAIVSCVPGRLAYYIDEEGERRGILMHSPG
jgi:hypothetical protein